MFRKRGGPSPDRKQPCPYCGAPDVNPAHIDHCVAISRKPGQSLESSDGSRTQVIIKETVREIVKVPCRHCGSLIVVTDPRCSSCGAPLQ